MQIDYYGTTVVAYDRVALDCFSAEVHMGEGVPPFSCAGRSSQVPANPCVLEGIRNQVMKARTEGYL